MDPLIGWALVCFVVAIVLFFIEVFVPSGGLIGLLSGVAAIAGVVLLFQVNTTMGLVGAFVTIAAIPFLIGLAIKAWPSTPVARWLTLGNPETPDNDPEAAAQTDAKLGHHASAVRVGDTGVALSDLRPIGTCKFDAMRTDCLASDGMIESGDTVEVVAADGMQIKVKKVG